MPDPEICCVKGCGKPVRIGSNGKARKTCSEACTKAKKCWSLGSMMKARYGAYQPSEANMAKIAKKISRKGS